KSYSEAYTHLKTALKGMEPPTPESLLLGIQLGLEMKDELSVNSYVKQLKSRYPMSPEWDEAMKLGYQ
ncbi:MAG TPA: hypothetical protein VIY47_16010, partial [Ignavibacteriaceae bacterium]